MTLIEFVTKWTGRGIDFDGAYGDQCMDLMHQYCVEVLGITDGAVLGAPAAKDVYLNFANIKGNELFDKIDNTPTGIPQPGDIMFWGTGIGQWGHVAIFRDGDANKFNSFDQNWNSHQYCEIVSHTYAAVLGWLHFKPAVNTQAIIDELRTARDNNYNLYQAELTKNNELSKQVQDEQAKSQSLREALDKQTTADADTGTQLLEVSHQKDELKGIVDATAGALNTTSDLKAILTAIDTLKQPHEAVVEQVQPVLDGLAGGAFYEKPPKQPSFIAQIIGWFFHWFK